MTGNTHTILHQGSKEQDWSYPNSYHTCIHIHTIHTHTHTHTTLLQGSKEQEAMTNNMLDWVHAWSSGSDLKQLEKASGKPRVCV